jgi:hypothetical protein
MKCMKNIKIKNCSVRVRSLAEPLGFKTLLAFYKFLKQCNPNARIAFGVSHVRAVDARKLCEREAESA